MRTNLADDVLASTATKAVAKERRRAESTSQKEAYALNIDVHAKRAR